MSLAVANTILAQLGGNKFRAMTGAKDFIGGANYLQFGLPARFAKNGINKVKIELNADDLYDVRFMKVNARKYTVDDVRVENGVYAEDLQILFTDATGLDTKLF